MRYRDIIKMAAQNLWSRKLRTTMNLFGIVLGCVVLMMTLAGTRGVSKSFESLLQGSEDARKFAIHRHYSPKTEPPASAITVAGKMSEKRRLRIQKRLKQLWLSTHAQKLFLSGPKLKQLEGLPHISEIVPHTHFHCRMNLERLRDNVLPDQSHNRIVDERQTAIGISLIDSRLNARVFLGESLQPGDESGVLLSEFTAYQFGYVSDSELKQLIGQSIEIEFLMKRQQAASFIQLFNWNRENPIDEVETLAAIKSLMDNIDTAPLSLEEKERLREIFQQPESSPGEKLSLTKRCVIRGIFRPSEKNDGDPFSFFRKVRVDEKPDLYLPHQVATPIYLAHENFAAFNAAIASVDDVSHLKTVIKEVESIGFRTHSALWVMEAIERDIAKVRLAISALALLIFIIAAIGISNTMVVSVLERTGEFGIMKAIGARDRHILLLMMIEGLLTGILGAGTAIIFSVSLSKLIATLVQKQISTQIRQEFSQNVFAFSIVDVASVLGIAMLVCSLASLFPAWRAARLDPVVAMRKN